jgi:hypothetical protein
MNKPPPFRDDNDRVFVADIAEECLDVAEGDVDRAMALFDQMTNADEALRRATRQWMMVLKTYPRNSDALRKRER